MSCGPVCGGPPTGDCEPGDSGRGRPVGVVSCGPPTGGCEPSGSGRGRPVGVVSCCPVCGGPPTGGCDPGTCGAIGADPGITGDGGRKPGTVVLVVVAGWARMTGPGACTAPVGAGVRCRFCAVAGVMPAVVATGWMGCNPESGSDVASVCAPIGCPIPRMGRDAIMTSVGTCVATRRLTKLILLIIVIGRLPFSAPT